MRRATQLLGMSIAGSLLITIPVSAAPIYLYNTAAGAGANYVTGNTTWARVPQSGVLDITSAAPFTLNFDTATALNPASNYTGPIFFGGAKFTLDAGSPTMNPTSNQAMRMVNSINDDRIQIQAVSTAVGTYSGKYQLATVFSLGDNYTLQSLLLRFIRATTGLANDSLRMLVGDGSNWWVSTTTSNPNASTLTTYSLPNTGSALWRSFNTSSFAVGGTDQSMPTSVSFAGFYFDGAFTFTSSSTSAQVIENFGLDAFAYEGTVVPEPASLALMGLACGLMLRRRSKGF